MHLGAMINKYRKLNDWSMQDFSDRAGISKMYVSKLEKNVNEPGEKKIYPSVKTLRGCAKAMSMTLDDLIYALDDDYLIPITYPGATPEEAVILQKLAQDIDDKVLSDAKKRQANNTFESLTTKQIQLINATKNLSDSDIDMLIIMAERLSPTPITGTGEEMTNTIISLSKQKRPKK